VHRRTFSHARKAGKLEFTHRDFRLREVGMIHEHALGVVKRGLRELGMIPKRPMKTARECGGMMAVSKRAHFHGDRAAERG
ncbi:MAG: hypothetical protein WAU82_21900, partial [Candidatus Binatus sp.]|uniref:hypothetical protein n=1 Tax=Candidatus Binatus sp. TaxID=2811406 RepID=UPI003BB062B3